MNTAGIIHDAELTIACNIHLARLTPAVLGEGKFVIADETVKLLNTPISETDRLDPFAPANRNFSDIIHYTCSPPKNAYRICMA